MRIRTHAQARRVIRLALTTAANIAVWWVMGLAFLVVDSTGGMWLALGGLGFWLALLAYDLERLRRWALAPHEEPLHGQPLELAQ